MSSVGFLGSSFAYSSDAIQTKMRGHGSPPGGWPTRYRGKMPPRPKGAKKVRTRVLRRGKLMVVEPEEIYDADVVLGEEAKALGPGWIDVEGWEDYELASGTPELPAPGTPELGWDAPLQLEAGYPQ